MMLVLVFCNLVKADDAATLAKQLETFWNGHADVSALQGTLKDILGNEDSEKLATMFSNQGIKGSTLLPKLSTKGNKVFIGSQKIFEIIGKQVVVNDLKFELMSEDESFADYVDNVHKQLSAKDKSVLMNIFIPKSHAFFGAFFGALAIGAAVAGGFTLPYLIGFRKHRHRHFMRLHRRGFIAPPPMGVIGR